MTLMANNNYPTYTRMLFNNAKCIISNFRKQFYRVIYRIIYRAIYRVIYRAILVIR